MKATELVEKLKNVFLSEEVAQDEVKDVEAQAEVVSAELEAQTEVEEVVAEGLAEAPVSSPEDVMSPEDVVEEVAEGEDKYATKEELASAIAEMKAMYDAIMQNMKSEEQMEVPAELSEDLSSQEVAQPLMHSPEVEVSKQDVMMFAKNRPMTTLDLVMSKIAK
jgi:hypothetical protein